MKKCISSLLFAAIISLTLVSCKNDDINYSNESLEDSSNELIESSDEQLSTTINNIGYSDTYFPIGDDILNCDQWYLQYPSGTDSGGMLGCSLSPSLANKYFSRADNYIKFSLDAKDKGKSPNGSSVRSELHSIGEKYYFSGNDLINNINHIGNSAEFNYTFKVNCTQPDVAKYTVGQFEMYSGWDYLDDTHIPDKPLIMISVIEGELYACMKYYNRSYVDGHFVKLEKQLNLPLGTVRNMEEISIKIVLNDRKVDIYRDGNHLVDTSFPDNQDTMYGVYFKLGVYYQTKQDDERITYMFTDVYVKDVSLVQN